MQTITKFGRPHSNTWSSSSKSSVYSAGIRIVSPPGSYDKWLDILDDESYCEDEIAAEKSAYWGDLDESEKRYVAAWETARGRSPFVQKRVSANLERVRLLILAEITAASKEKSSFRLDIVAAKYSENVVLCGDKKRATHCMAWRAYFIGLIYMLKGQIHLAHDLLSKSLDFFDSSAEYEPSSIGRCIELRCTLKTLSRELENKRRLMERP
jgi:hypothetical protein